MSKQLLTDDEVRTLARSFGTPVYVYDERGIRERAEQALGMLPGRPLIARFAMKAFSTKWVLRRVHELGLWIDASSGNEVRRALAAGIPGAHISLTAQEFPDDAAPLFAAGVTFISCSLRQLELYGSLRPGTDVGVRFNPGLGSGHSKRTNVGGPSSSFGIWHEDFERALAAARHHGLTITCVHSHIGSGADPEVAARCAELTLALAVRIETVRNVNLGGGFKVARVPDEKATDLAAVGRAFAKKLAAAEVMPGGRRLTLEIEPGAFIMANAGALVGTVIDMTSTGSDGYRFLKSNVGMPYLLRPALYGAQHAMYTVPAEERPGADEAWDDFVAVGPCCESGDILTPASGNPEELGPRRMRVPQVGDFLVVLSTGAYASGFSVDHYCSFLGAPEVVRRETGEFALIKRRETFEELIQREL